MPLTADVGRFVLWLVQVTVGAVTVASVVLALRSRPLSTRREASLARAQWLTVAVALVVGYLVAVAVLRYLEHNPLGVVVFLTLCAAATVGGVVLRWAWRAHAAAAIEERPPDVPLPPRPHEGLSGGQEPPKRW